MFENTEVPTKHYWYWWQRNGISRQFSNGLYAILAKKDNRSCRVEKLSLHNMRFNLRRDRSINRWFRRQALIKRSR